MSLLKALPARDPEYLKWVRTQPSVISGKVTVDPDTGETANDPHHIKVKEFGLGGSSKTSDYLTIPLTHDEHMDFHKIGQQSWEAKHNTSQVWLALQTLERWVIEQERDS